MSTDKDGKIGQILSSHITGAQRNVHECPFRAVIFTLFITNLKGFTKLMVIMACVKWSELRKQLVQDIQDSGILDLHTHT